MFGTNVFEYLWRYWSVAGVMERGVHDYVVSAPVRPARERIVDILRDVKYARARDLAKVLGVSLGTVRKYLKDLEDEGLVRRVYDGSVKYDVEWLGDASLNSSES